MMNITVEKPDAAKLASLGVKSWPTWSKEVSTFPWSYQSQEIAYILEGEVTVTPKSGGAPVSFGVGDLVTFPAGLSCVWDVKKPLRKHYQFS
ncbi:MAG TPA: cupin domain-containing protein [Methylotenera sp.]|nr:cupin domain-containing protein [Methylotenera sp.]